MIGFFDYLRMAMGWWNNPVSHSFYSVGYAYFTPGSIAGTHSQPGSLGGIWFASGSISGSAFQPGSRDGAFFTPGSIDGEAF